MGIEIVLMTPALTAGVAALERACFSQPWSEAAFLGELRNPDAVTLVAVEGGGVLGFLNARKICGEVYINNVAVAIECRRRGIAETLLVALETAVKPCAFITLEVRASNLPAQKLYEKCGYRSVGMRRNFYASPTENAVLMTKDFENEPEARVHKEGFNAE